MTGGTLPLPTSPLIEKLCVRPDSQRLDAQSLEAFLRQPGDQILFFHGDPAKRPESHDIAVVLPELLAHFPDRFQVGVMDPRDDIMLMPRFGVLRLPSLVFLREGRFLGIIAQIQPWTEMAAQTAAFLDASPETEMFKSTERKAF